MKQFLFFIALMCIAISSFAIEFTVAPLYFIDETSEQVNARNNYDNRLLQELSKASADMELRFKGTGISRHNPPQSVGDAIVLCRAERADYLIYGFIVKKDQSIQGELRLLDYERKEVIASFFAMDNSDHEDALIKELSNKLFRFIQETYNIIIVPEPAAFTHIQFPFGLGYWLPVNKDWRELLLGIVRVDFGIQIIPSDNLFVADGYVHYISLEFDISYQLGKGRNYRAWDHGFTASALFQVHRKLNEQHDVFAGFGLTYSVDLLRITNPYEDPVTETYSAFGGLFSGGWIFRFKEQLFFYEDARFELRFYKKPMLSFAPRAGIILRKYTWEVVKKW